jgi:hypothetical protein
MNRRLSVFLVSLGLLLLPVVPAQTSPPGPTAESRAPVDKLVAAYYFYWYNVYTGQHFVDPDHTDAMTDHPPDSYLSNYSWTEVAWHRREMLDMMAAQVDIVLPVYWGSDQEAYWSVPGLQNLVVAEQQLIGEGSTPPRIGMFYDTTALQQQNGGVKPDLTTPAGKALFYGMISDFYQLVPPSLWALVDGHPLVWLYTSEFVSTYDQSTFSYVAQQFQADFGVTPYIVREASWQGVTTDGVYYWGVALNGPMTIGRVGSLGPGYDETAVYGRPNPRVRDRECGEFYADGWETIGSSGVTLLGIETWNEFHEGTDIAPSREYSTTYVALTAQNVARWKATDYGSAPLVWLDLGQSPYAQGLRPAFNFADGAWLVTWLAGRQAAYPNHTTTPQSYFIYLDVNDDFISASPSEVWVTVEYFDGGTGGWVLEYDSTGNPYTALAMTLQNSGQWKRHTFHLTDAYFGGRQNNGADLRVSDNAWWDGETDYFGRVWIAKAAPSDQAPDLLGLNDVQLRPGEVLDIPISASDPDGGPVALTLDRGPGFASLTDHGDGTGVLHLAPGAADSPACASRLRVLATDAGSPALADAATIQATISQYAVFLPLVVRNN